MRSERLVYIILYVSRVSFQLHVLVKPFNDSWCRMDGANRETIASLSGYSYGVQGLALDVGMNRIYFITRYRSRGVSYINLNSSSRSVETLARLYYDLPYYGYPHGIAVDGQYVYFSYRRSYYSRKGKVYRINKTRGGGHLETVVLGLSYPRGIAVQGGKTKRKSEYTHFLLIWVPFTVMLFSAYLSTFFRLPWTLCSTIMQYNGYLQMRFAFFPHLNCRKHRRKRFFSKCNISTWTSEKKIG